MVKLSWLSSGLLMVMMALTGCAGAQAQADDESLRDSFAEQIETSSFVSEFSRVGDEITFSGPGREGGTVEWRVVIDTSLVEPNQFDDAKPYVGRVTSAWYADGEIVEYLGNMTALPKEILDRGLAQECWANWVEAEYRWDWL